MHNMATTGRRRALPPAAAMALLLPLLLGGCGQQTPSSAPSRATSADRISDKIQAAWNDDRHQAPWPPTDGPPPRELDPERTRDNLMLVLDMSGSMSENACAAPFQSKAMAARAAFKGWLAGVPEDTNVGLAIFENDRIRIAVPPGRGEGNRQALLRAADASRPKGGTPLSVAVHMGRRALEQQALLQQGYGTYRLVVITDGLPNDGYDPTDEVLDILANRNNPIEIHTIGFCITDSALNLPGLTYYQAANNPGDLRSGLDQILAEAPAFDPDTFEALATGIRHSQANRP